MWIFAAGWVPWGEVLNWPFAGEDLAGVLMPISPPSQCPSQSSVFGVGWLLRSHWRHLRWNSHKEESIVKVTRHLLVALIRVWAGQVQVQCVSPCYLRTKWGFVSMCAFPVSRLVSFFFFFPTTNCKSRTRPQSVITRRQWSECSPGDWSSRSLLPAMTASWNLMEPHGSSSGGIGE